MNSEKEELLALLLKEKGFQAAPEPSIRPLVLRDDLPLSFAQQRLWILDQLEPGNPAYNIPIALRLQGRLELDALEWSLNQIVKRHEALRTAFHAREGQPFQVILPEMRLVVPLISLETYPKTAQMAPAQQLMQEMAWSPFDLERGPLIRTCMLRLSSEEHIWLLTVHHIIADGWSLELLLRELSTLYNASLRGEPSCLPDLPVQYADFASWQREWLTGDVLQEQLSYWKQHLQDAPAALDIRTDWPRRPVQTWRGLRLSATLPASLTRQLQALSQREGATLFMTLLAAFYVLLARYSGQEDIVVGTPVAGRNHSEIEQLIGYFLNSLALRVNLEHDPTFRDVLRQVLHITLAAYDYQDLPFELILQELQIDRLMSHTPLFQVFFNMLNFGGGEPALAGLRTEYLSLAEVPSKFDLTLYAEERQDGIHLDLVYNTDLFARPRMAAMLEQYRYLLEQVVAYSEERISNYSLVNLAASAVLPAPTEHLNDNWNGAIHTRLTQLARLRPARTAIVEGQREWSYRDLDARSSQLAHYLCAHGVQRRDVVAIYGYRNAALVCAVLGVLKAGAVFCILDPAYPPARLVSYLQMLSPRAWIQITEAGQPHDTIEDVLQQSSCYCRLEISTGLLEAERNALREYPIDNPEITIGPHDRAYISFTSGSTGRPKGVIGKHGSLTHFFPWQADTYGLSNEDRYSLLSGLSHDPLHREIFTPLWFGATICIPTTEDINLPGRLASWIRQQQISIAHLSPAMIQILTQSPADLVAGGGIASLRYAFLMSDVVTRHDVARMRSIAPRTICVNSYGATETQRAVANYIISDEIYPSEAKGERNMLLKEIIPVGRGIQDVQLLVLQRRSLRLAGIGEVGEIYIRSPHLAEGYLDDEALTRERFIPNPFTHEEGDRLYRTGDLGWYLSDGNVEVLGRCDQQVKIRGFRIELGEVEACLRQIEGIKEALVVMREDIPGDKRLVAYIVPRHRQYITSSDMHRLLKGRLPDYMIPSSFVRLERIPVMPNGKVDRNSLPVPAQVEPGIGECFDAPRTQVEEVLAALWSQVLNTGAASIHENFFAAGGHSLLAVQFMARVQDAFQVELPLRSLFDAPTIADLASVIETAMQTGLRKSLARIPRTARRQGAPLSFAQQRLWFLEQMQPGNTFYNLHATVRLKGSLHKPALEQSLTEIIRRHEVLRTTFVATDGQPRQVIAFPSPVPLPVVDLRAMLRQGEREAVALQLIEEEAQSPFFLAQGPLFRSKLLQLQEDEYLLLLTLHHIVSDGWSTGVFVRELTTLYRAFSQGEASPLPELPIQYADYATWQNEWIRGGELQGELSYWSQRLKGAPALLELPTDRARPTVQSFQGARIPLALSRALTEQLKALSRQQGVSLFMTLLAAFKVLLARYSRQEDIVVGTPIAGRNQSETEELIGCFVNTLVLRTDLSGNPSFSDLLHRVREVCLEAYAHQNLPFERLVEALQPERDISRNPLFQVMFVLQSTAVEDLELTGLVLSFPEIENKTARFDVVLSLTERPEGLSGHFEYNTGLFNEQTLAQMKAHFQHLLEQIVADPEQSVGLIPLLGPEERQKMLVEWNATRTGYPHAICMHQLFESQVRRTPDAPAVVCKEERLTYAELNARANQLAHYLRAMGVGPEVRVGIGMERCVEMMIALLGVLKAGGTYVPLDPALPPERLTFMLEDAQIRTLLTLQGSPVRSSARGPLVICLDSERFSLEQQPTDNPPGEVGPANLAYIIYTSGSTGTPKGVMIPHQGLVNYLSWCCQQYGVAEGEGTPVHSPISFDLTITSVFSPLLVGRCVFLLENEPGIAGLSAAFRANREFSLVKITPAHLKLLEYELAGQQCTGRVKTFVIGGEQLLAEHVNFWRAVAPHTALINEYGPTETVVGCCVYQVPQEGPPPEPIPIGRPIANVQLYLLDQFLQPVPPGVPGELYIGGDGVARGYLNHPALTAERFIPDPFSGVPGARLYRTGDLARYLHDGMLTFLGRNDRQVKLRGYRIEPGEIESALLMHPAIAAATAIIRQDQTGNSHLVAYIVPRASDKLSLHELQGYLKERLPAYMIPAHILPMDKIPLTTNGKIDYPSLPEPDSYRRAAQAEYSMPQNSIERTIAAIWEDILHVEKIGRNDNFFELGGHSLLLLQMRDRLQQALHCQLSVVELFQYPTIHALTTRIKEQTDILSTAQQYDRRAAQVQAGKLRAKRRLEQRSQSK